jgi:hypothetical protein
VGWVEATGLAAEAVGLAVASVEVGVMEERAHDCSSQNQGARQAFRWACQGPSRNTTR